MATPNARERRITASNKRITVLRTRLNKAQAVVSEVSAKLEYETELLAWVEQMPATATEAELPAESGDEAVTADEDQSYTADPFSQTAGVNPELPVDAEPISYVDDDGNEHQVVPEEFDPENAVEPWDNAEGSEPEVESKSRSRKAKV